METSGSCGGGAAAEAPVTRRPASKWRELMSRRARERRSGGGSGHLNKRAESQTTTHNDDLMSLDWTENMRQMCDRLFAADGGCESATRKSEVNSAKTRSQRARRTTPTASQQISGNLQMMQQDDSVRSQSQTRPSWSVQRQVNNNCTQLAQWLAELAKIPPHVARADGQDAQRRLQRTQAANYQTNDYDIDNRIADQLRPMWQSGDTQASHTNDTPTTVATRATNTSRESCVCCSWASLHPHERARQLYEERNGGDNLSALSASSSLLSQLLNSSLNQLIEIDNGSSTCCLCDSGQPCGPALAATTDDCNQQTDLTSDGRAQSAAAESRGPYAGSDLHHLRRSRTPPPPSLRPTQQVVDERDLLVVTPMMLGVQRRSASQQAAHRAPAHRVVAAAMSGDHLTRSIQHQDERPTKSRAQLGDAQQHETTSQVMQAQEGDKQNGTGVRKGALNCDQFSVKSNAGSSSSSNARSCSTLTAAVTSDFERLREQILEVHRRRRASRKRNPLARGNRARQIENSQHDHLLSRSSSKQVLADGGRQQQFVTFDKDATSTISQRPLQSEVSPELESMNNQHAGGGNSADTGADLLECCRAICARTSSTALTQVANVTPKVKSVADHAQDQRRPISPNVHRARHAKCRRDDGLAAAQLTGNELRGAPPEAELINCSLIMGNGQQQHDSLLEVSKCSRAPSGQRQDHSSSSSSSCMESSLSCFTSLAHHARDLRERSQTPTAAAAAPQECDRGLLLPPEDYAQVKHAAASNKCLGKEGALLEQRRPFINHLNQRRPRGQAEEEQEEEAPNTQVFLSCDEQSRITSDAQSGGGQSRGSPASGTSISSSEVSLGDSHSSCAIRVTTTSGDSSEADCSCGLAANRATSNNAKQHVQVATSGQHQAADRGAAVASGPLEHATGNDEQRVVFSADCSAPNRKQEMGLIGSRQQQKQQQQQQNEHKHCDSVSRIVDSKGGSRREVKQYSKQRQAAHDRRRIDSICNDVSENDLLAAGEKLDSNYQLVASELCAWESKFAHHPSSSSAAVAAVSDLSSSSNQAHPGRSGGRAILSKHRDYFDDRSELLRHRQSGQTNHYITKRHQLTQAAQLYARNFVALPLHHQLVVRSARQEQEEEQCAYEDSGGRSRAHSAGVIFSLDPSLEAADRASMVEATAQMVRVITSRDSSRPSSRASSGAGTSKVPPATSTGQANSPRPHNVIDATTLEPIYDVPSLSQIDTKQRCLSPDQKYPNVGVADHSEASSSQISQLDKLGPLGETTSRGRNTLNGQQEAAIIEQKHNQRQRRPENDDDDDGGGGRNSHAESLRDDASGQILFHQPRESGNTNIRDQEARSNFKFIFGHSRTESRTKLQEQEKDDCDYKLQDDDNNKHKSSAADGREERQMTTKTAAKKKVTCSQPSETITTTTTTTFNANATNLNARQEQQGPATIRHTRREQRRGQSRRHKSQIDNLPLSSRANEATSALTSSCSCSTCCLNTTTTLDDGTTTVCSSSASSCSCSASNGSCSCFARSSFNSGQSSSILYLLRNQTRAHTCPCDDDDEDQSSDQSPGSLTQAYLRRHQRNRHHHHRRRRRSRRQVLAIARSGLRSPPRNGKRRRHHTSGPPSISSGRLLRTRLRLMQRRQHAHRAHSSRTNDYGGDRRGSSHGGHAGRSQCDSRLAPPRAANANSYKVFANDEHEHERVRPRSLIRSEHATGAPSKLAAATMGGSSGGGASQRHPLESLYVLDEEEEGEELAEAGGGGGNQRCQPQESEFVGGGGGEPSRTNSSAYKQNQQLPDDGDRGGSIIAGQHTRTRRRDQQQSPSELDRRESTRKRQVANLLLSDRNRAPGGGRGGAGATKINATATSPSRASREPHSSPNDDLNQHADDRARPRTRATSGGQCRLCRARTSERSCGSSCSRLTLVAVNHHHHHHDGTKSHYNTTPSHCLDDELNRIRLLRRRQRKLIRRLLEVGVGRAQEISPSTAADALAASKQLKIEYLSRQVGAVSRELKLQRRSYKSRVRHFYQQQQRRRHLKRKSSESSRRFNKPFATAAGASISHDIIRADESGRQRTNEGYPAASGLLRWRRLARRRPISGGQWSHAARSLNYSVASCCRRHRRCSLSSSSCVSGSLVTSLSRGAHLRTGGHHRRRWRRRRIERTRQHLGRKRRHNGGARPRRATETNDDSALRATTTTTERAHLNGGNMTTTAAASSARGQAATVGQARNMQQALIASGHTNRDASGRHVTWKRHCRHELNPTLTLVAAHERNRRQHGRLSSASGQRRGARKDARSERRRNNNPTDYVDYSKFNMDKFLVKRVNPSAKLMSATAAAAAPTSSKEIRRAHPSVPFTWQLANHCQCKHCCLVGTLVRMDSEGQRRRLKTNKDFYGAGS